MKYLKKYKLFEISSELKDRAVNKMKSLGYSNRATNLDKLYNNINYNFDEFIGKKLFNTDEFILNIEVKNTRDKKNITINLSNKRQYNTSNSSIMYLIDDDKYIYLPNENYISRKDVRLLSKIASVVNPNNKYLNGVGDIKINKY
jgi:hypothetical protein